MEYKELYELYIIKKLTLKEISKIKKCSKTTIWRKLKEFGIDTRLTGQQVKNYTSIYPNEMYLYLDKDLSIYDISKIQNLSPTGVWKRLKQSGVNMNSGEKLKGKHWAVKTRGEEYLGADGRYWIRGFDNRKSAKRRAVVVMEEILEGPIPEGLCVHHINGDPTDDRPENLCLVTRSQHNIFHFTKNKGENI